MRILAMLAAFFVGCSLNSPIEPARANYATMVDFEAAQAEYEQQFARYEMRMDLIDQGMATARKLIDDPTAQTAAGEIAGWATMGLTLLLGGGGAEFARRRVAKRNALSDLRKTNMEVAIADLKKNAML